MNTYQVEIKKFAHTGHGVGINEQGTELHILGAFPGDIVKTQVYKEAYGVTYAELIEIVEPSPHRIHIPTKKPFFDANAPWQHLHHQQEEIEKQKIVQQLFNTYEIEVNSGIVTPGPRTTHYRNKAAYSFIQDKNNNLTFALYTRGTAFPAKIPQEENLLVHESINKIGKQFLHFFNQKKVPLKTLKYLILRYSYAAQAIVAHILVTETSRKKLPWKKTDLEKFLAQHSSTKGILVSHSEAGIRSALTTKDFYSVGQTDIQEEVLGKQYTYHPSQFFQIYPEAFSAILKDSEELIKTIKDCHTYELLDLFAGVGIIGIHLAHLVQQVHGVERSPLASEYALRNSSRNNINNFNFTEVNVDQALLYIKSKQILVVDPPRSGLTKQVKEKILEVQPEYILYVSCNPETQAQDIIQLNDYYNIAFSKAYNLFPKTSHIEHLMFLKRK